MKKITQEQRLLEYLKANGYITRMDAPSIGVANLTAVVSNLRKKGIEVRCESRRSESGAIYGAWYLEA